MKKREIFMLSTVAFTLGVVFGFLLSPVKEGIIIYGGDNTNNNYNKKPLTTDESQEQK